MTVEYLGLCVTVFNPEIVEPSRHGKIVGFDDETIHITFGDSKKIHKLPYSPRHILLRLVQKDFNYFIKDIKVKKELKPVPVPVKEEKVEIQPKPKAKPRAKRKPTTNIIEW